MSRLPLHALDVDAIHSTLASMSISSPSDIGWSSPHPVAASRRTEAARAESVVSHPALSSVLPPDSSSFLVSPKSPSDGIFARQLNFDNSQQQPISAIQYRSPQASKSASYINAMWREQFQSRGEALGADLAVAPVMPKEPPLQRVDVPSSYALEHRDPRVDSESLERVALERIELELALAIERKNALVSLKRSLSQRIEEHLTQQRQIAERARLDSVAHFESVQEELSIALCSKVLSSANAVFDNSRAQESSSSSSVPNNFAYESLLDRELQRDIETLVVDLKAKVTRELELEMEAELTARMGAEESALRARRKHWADLAKSDAEALHVTKTQEELLRLEAEDGASTSASMERSFVDKLADIRPKDFYDNAKKRGFVTMQYVNELFEEVAQASKLSSLDNGDIPGFLDKEQRKIDVKDPGGVTTEILLRLMYEDVASLGKIALAMEVALQRHSALAARFEFEARSISTHSL